MKDTVKNFIDAVSCVCLPEINLKYHIEKLWGSIESPDKFKRSVKNYETDLYEKIMSAKTKSSICGQKLESIKQICIDLKNRLPDILKMIETGTEPSSKIHEKLITQEIRDVISSGNKLAKPSSYLKDYSPYLASYPSDSELEIPGQYSGNKKPLIKYHVKLTGFEETITIFTRSQRKPIKVLMFGNDSKKYEFIVKFGEDLRQDQRIEQLFSISQNIFQKDADCVQRNLSIETYGVVPLTHYVGLIKCVSNTRLLKDFIFGDSDKVTMDKYNKITSDYIKWLESAPNVRRIDRSVKNSYFANAAIAYNREKTITKYREHANRIPYDILKYVQFFKIF